MAKANVKVTFLCPVEKVWDTVTDLKKALGCEETSKIQIF